VNKIGTVLVSTLVVALLVCSLAPLVVQAAAPVISDVQACSVTENGAVITWVTNTNATGNVEYGTESGVYTDGAPTPADGTADHTSHAAILSALSSGTTYYYRVKSSDGTDETTSAEYSFTTTAFTISVVTASSITLTSATITWNTNVLATSNVEYGTTQSYGSSAPATPDASADNTAHIVVLSGLTADTTYHYRVKSTDASSNEELSDDFAFATLSDTTPPEITSVSPSGITIATTTTATITWDTDEPATSQVEYGTSSTTHGNYDSITSVDNALLSAHSVSLGGLSPDTIYYYRAISKDAYDNETASAECWFRTAADTTQPVISSISASGITSTTAVITWTTNEASTSQVEYGTSTLYGSASPLDSNLVTSHSVFLAGLTPGTLHHYRVKSADGSGNETISTDYEITTLSDTAIPVISGITTSGVTITTVTIGWNTNEPATSQVEYGPTASYGSTTALDPALIMSHSVSLSGLESSTVYHYRVKSTDGSGNPATSADQTFYTTDVVAPSTPANISQDTLASDSTPTFTWDASTDACSGLAFYQVRLDSDSFDDIGNVTTFTVADDDSLPDGSHTFEVRAVDNVGNVSQAGSLSFNIDSTPPTTPTNVAKTDSDRDATPTFTWDAATDATSGLQRYQVSVDSGGFANIGTDTTYTMEDGTPLSDGSHTFQVRAVDRAGNAGEAASLAFTVDTTPPSTPDNIARTSPDGDSTPTFTWDAATDATSGVAAYQVRMDSGDFLDVADNLTFTVDDADALSGGDHVFQVRTIDNAGNISEPGSLSFQVPTTLSWAIILGIVAGVLAVVAAIAFVITTRHSGTPPRQVLAHAKASVVSRGAHLTERIRATRASDNS
jgi:phosphodiesterase/alkaline phosphatase D-like protein